MSSRRSTRSREEGKELTRQALLRAALKLLSRNSFDSISLREVTREAGISPTAFYRHFDDMEELGLALVDESFGSLRQMLRDARADPTLIANAVDRSVETVVLATKRNESHFRFISRERYGGVKRIRKAIRRELQLFADELAVDLAVFPFVRDWSVDDRRMLSSIITETMVHMTAELLDADGAEADAVIERARQQLMLINLGVPSWVGPASRALLDDNARRGLENDAERYYHGTRAQLEPGDLIEAGHRSNYGSRRTARHVYLTATVDAAVWGAELATGDGPGRIYVVEPTGPIEDDPNLTGKKFPGNPTKSYRSRDPLRVVGELTDWEGHDADTLQAMKDNLARLAAQGVEAID